MLAKLFVLSFGVLFFVSPDSYTHDTFEQFDTAWFFTCGKAWMSGMTPYVDFADSKGPLLWLIYGVGYLISSFNYIGVFWLSVLLYTAVFYYVYLIAKLFLKKDDISFFVTVCMTLSYFCHWFHHEIRAEDWCQLFIAMTFYYSCRWLYATETKNHRDCHIACFVLGISLAGTLLIKYTITAMLGVVACYMLYAVIREKENILYSFLSFLSGFLIMIAPFVIYMMCVGCFGAFIQEYFLNTLQTVDTYNTVGTYLHEWLMPTHETHALVLLLLCCVGAYLMSKVVKRDKYFFLVSFIGFYAISVHHYLFYYLCSSLFFPLFFIIPVVRQLPNFRPRSFLTVSIICFVVFMNSFNQGFVSDSWFFKDSSFRKDYYNVAYIMSGVSNPTVVHYVSSEHGQGIPSGALPGAKYWATQLGATPEMKMNQEEAIQKHQTDFVIVSNLYPGLEEHKDFVLSSGYRLIYEYTCWGEHYFVFTKHQNLPLPPSDFHVSSTDILLKRNIFNK